MMEIMEKQWLSIDQKDITKPKLSRKRGVKVKMMVSPSDVPSAVRYYLDEQDNKLVVEFKYLSSPEKLVLDKYSGADMLVGKNSRKIYKVVFDTKDVMDHHSGRVRLEMIVNAEETMNGSSDNHINHENKGIIDNIFKSKYIKNLGIA